MKLGFSIVASFCELRVKCGFSIQRKGSTGLAFGLAEVAIPEGA
jgi:hypothetical protein